MKFLLEVKDEKVEFVLELLRNFKFIKAKPLSPYKAEVFESLQSAVEEMKKVKKGELKGTPARDLLDEL